MAAGGGVAMEPDSDAELAELVCQLADDRESLAAQARHARTYVAEHFNRDQLAAEYLELLEEVAAPRRHLPKKAVAHTVANEPATSPAETT